MLLALLAEVPMVLKRGGHVESLLATGLHDGPTPIVGITSDHALDARGWLELLDQVGGHLSRLPEG
jgi:hypothetical protein